MRTKDIIRPLVGTKKIVVKDIFLDAEANDLVISARPTKKEQCRCSHCHRKAKYYDAGRGLRLTRRHNRLPAGGVAVLLKERLQTWRRSKQRR